MRDSTRSWAHALWLWIAFDPLSKLIPALHVEWWRAYYHFVRPHETLREMLAQPRERGGKRLPQRYRQRTPAMAAGLTSRRWMARDLLAVPLPPGPMGAG